MNGPNNNEIGRCRGIGRIALIFTLLAAVAAAEEPLDPAPEHASPGSAPVSMGDVAPASAPDLTPEQVFQLEEKEQAVRRLEKLSEEIAADVARRRGLPFKSPVRKGIQSRGELRDYLARLMNVKQPRERFDAIARAYTLLGLLPPGIDLQKLVLDLLQQEVAGFYDPEAKALFLIDEWSLSQCAIISHELTHAVQDQHFDLQSLPMEDETREDLAVAVRSLVEGEGMLVMMLYLSEAGAAQVGLFESLLGLGFKSLLDNLDQPDLNMSWQGSESLFPGLDPMASVPLVIRESLVFPYLQGLNFVHKAWRQGGWEAVNALYRDLPQSTEQVMHPEKFFRAERDRPTLVEIADLHALAPAGYRMFYHSVLGELYISILFRQFLGDSAHPSAWVGWDGDHFIAFAQPDTGASSFLWVTVWDSEGDAAEFEAAYQQLLARRKEAEEKTVEAARAAGGTPVLHVEQRVERRGTEVQIVGSSGVPEGDAADFLHALANKAWEARTLKESPAIESKGSPPVPPK
ncbi:MAG: hypothetical protein HYU36_02785 [Planctomycetes bacterium]|nr:hypothetical protein [Planctomycetota bacterium]